LRAVNFSRRSFNSEAKETDGFESSGRGLFMLVGFNNERPHEALDMKCPAEVYQPCTRPYTGLPDIDYPLHDKTIVVTRCGRICLARKKASSARSSLDRPSASKKCMTTSG
jgi:hypothetical protein